MAKYRKKPVVVEAVQFDGTPGGAIRVFETFDIPDSRFHPHADLATGSVSIRTPEGTMMAVGDDWIIKGVKGEFYPCKDEIFKLTYDPIE